MPLPNSSAASVSDQPAARVEEPVAPITDGTVEEPVDWAFPPEPSVDQRGDVQADDADGSGEDRTEDGEGDEGEGDEPGSRQADQNQQIDWEKRFKGLQATHQRYVEQNRAQPGQAPQQQVPAYTTDEQQAQMAVDQHLAVVQERRRLGAITDAEYALEAGRAQVAQQGLNLLVQQRRWQAQQAMQMAQQQAMLEPVARETTIEVLAERSGVKTQRELADFREFVSEATDPRDMAALAKAWQRLHQHTQQRAKNQQRTERLERAVDEQKQVAPARRSGGGGGLPKLSGGDLLTWAFRQNDKRNFGPRGRGGG